MSDMIERVARAICKTDYDGRDFDDLRDGLQDVYREYARAAVAAVDSGEGVSYPREYGEHDLIVPKLHYDALVRAMFDIHRAFYDRGYPAIEAALLACKEDIGKCVSERNSRLFPDGATAIRSPERAGE